ncbi:MAG TPA: hypothetical protein VMR25_17140 [Planctomycetaceae bacterium]|nr:hypothetical protein [Planctomycetaceae bacterium]
MDALAAEPLDNLLTELTQADAVEREFWIFLRHAEDIALGGISVHAEKQVGRRKMKQAQGMRLGHLSESEDAAQFVGGGRNSDRQQLIAGLGRSDEVADGTDAADARHQRGHLVKRAALAKLLESPELSNVKAGFLDAAIFVEMKRDFGMAFDARYRIDEDGLALLHEISLSVTS